MTEKIIITGMVRDIKRDIDPERDEDNVIIRGAYLGASDGYHTFEELYDHRITLFIALCRERMARFQQEAWRSRFHHDGSELDGWFILGLGRAAGDQITYHIPISRWDETDFADTLDTAPKFDGHTSRDVLDRLKKL